MIDISVRISQRDRPYRIILRGQQPLAVDQAVISLARGVRKHVNMRITEIVRDRQSVSVFGADPETELNVI